MAGASSTSIRFPHKLNAAFNELRLSATYPHLAKAIQMWWTDDYTQLFETKRNGSGKQIVLKYAPQVFLEFISLALQAHHSRAELTRDRKEAYVAVMVATGLLTAENAGWLVGASRSSVTQWGTKRSPNFPLSRLGGSVNAETLMMLAAWWKGKSENPNDTSNDWMLISANEKDASWPVLARLTGQSMYEIQRNTRRVQSGRTETISVTINHAAPPVQADPGYQGHLPGGSERDSTPRQDLVDYDDPDFAEGGLKPPVAVDGGDAFASAAYLAAVPETDPGNAGQPGATQDGVHPSGEGDRGDGEEQTGRPVHPFLQQE